MPPHDGATADETVAPRDGSPIAVADYGTVGAGLDALGLPASTDTRTTADRVRRIARGVLPPVVAIVLLIAIW
ncbi:MAG TPA: ABC transporter permease, partial [Pseudonocardiaceae bacterium]|nr:ABC transporter permease [Pseudonocardiaceae bacterium]